ncbi:hypothetical protein D3C87_125150 [compost metagenome]
MKTQIIRILILTVILSTQAGCPSGGGGSAAARSADPIVDPGNGGGGGSTPWTAPQTISAAESDLRGDWISTRDANNFLKVDNQGNWSFQLASGYYRVVNSQQVLTPYTYLVSGTHPVASVLDASSWRFTFTVVVPSQYAPFDGIYDDQHNRLAIEFTTETCIVIRVKALNQNTYDTYCK